MARSGSEGAGATEEQLAIRRAAELDWTTAQGWYEEQRPGVGLRFSTAVESALEQIEHNPYQFPLLEKNVRRALLHRFPYGIYFVVDGRNASVIALLHAKRDPSAWRDRT